MMLQKRSVLGLVFLLVLVLVFSGCGMWDNTIPDHGDNTDNNPGNGIGDGDDGGIDFSLPDLSLNEVRFRDLRGTPVVVFFFKSYCPHCQDEAPFLESVYRRYKGQVEFLGIAVNEQGTSGTLIASTTSYAQQIVRDFVQPYGWTFPVLIDDYGRVQRQLVGTGVPAFVFVDGYGVVRGTVKDTVSQSRLEQLIRFYLVP
jgi:thiol-disulfide isomerase/thioredoxin